MKSQILEAYHLVPGDKVKTTLELGIKDNCVLFVGVVTEDDELFSDFLKMCE